MDENTCPFDTACFDPTPGGATGDHYCADACETDGDCRTGEGYACLALDVGDPMSPKGCVLP